MDFEYRLNKLEGRYESKTLSWTQIGVIATILFAALGWFLYFIK